jgi:hypothetical protein
MSLVRSPNGGFKDGAPLTGDAQFFVLHTVIAVESGNFGTTVNAQHNLRKIAEVLQNKSVLNYIKVSEQTVDLSDPAVAAVYNLGADFNQPATPVYTVKFVTEQPGFIVVADMLEELNGLFMPFGTYDVPVDGPTTIEIDTIVTTGNLANLSLAVFEQF